MKEKMNENMLEKHALFRIFLWGCVIIIFFVTGFFLYRDNQVLNLQSPKLSSKLEDNIKAIKQLDSEYAEIIKEKKEFYHVWSMIAVVAAVLTSIAVALRAPQSFIIVPGAFIAMIYTAIELQSPKTIINSLSRARESLYCVESNVNELFATKERYFYKINELISNVENGTEKIKTYLFEIKTYHRNLVDILQINAEERHAAMLEVNKGLMIPLKDNFWWSPS